VYAALIDSPEYDALSANAAAIWWALKCAPETGMTGIFPVFADQLSQRSKVPAEWVAGAMQELVEGGWIKTEGRWVWIRNHLRYDPSYRPDNPKHVTGLLERMAGLPRIALVVEFVRYYQALGYLPANLESETRNSIPVAVAVAVPITTALAVHVSKAAPNPSSDERDGVRALIDAYNGVFNAKVSLTPGNVKAGSRLYGAGYTLEQALTVFHAVHESRTPTAAWCAGHNREFEYLCRPEYRSSKTKELVPAVIDRVLNELATGRRADA
jgi:hypothetical protein